MTVKITYADFVDLLMEKSGASRTTADRFMHTLIEILHAGLERDGHAAVRGLGRFELRWQNERIGRNPQTGDSMNIPAHYKIHFKPDIALRRFFNRKYAKLKPKYLPRDETKQTADIHPVDEERAEPVQKMKRNEQDFEPEMADIQPRAKEKTGSSGWLSRAWIAVPIIVVIIILLLIFRKEPARPVAEKKPVNEIPAAQEVVPEKREITPAIPGAVHRVKPGDQFWKLSGDYYDSPYVWPYIYGANDVKVKNPDFLSPAAELIIPPLAGRSGSLTKTDKVQIAEGFLKTYLAYQKAGRKDAYTYLWTASRLDGENLIRKYAGQIDKNDLERVNRIRGTCKIF